MTLVYDADNIDVDLKAMDALIATVYEKVDTWEHAATESHGTFLNKVFEELISEKVKTFFLFINACWTVQLQ